MWCPAAPAAVLRMLRQRRILLLTRRLLQTQAPHAVQVLQGCPKRPQPQPLLLLRLLLLRLLLLRLLRRRQRLLPQRLGRCRASPATRLMCSACRAASRSFCSCR